MQVGGQQLAGVDDSVLNYLLDLSVGIRKFNELQANGIIDGTIKGNRSELNSRLVRDEQRYISGELIALKNKNSRLYNNVISTMNRSANPKDSFTKFMLFISAPTVTAAANDARKELGRDIDFSIESDRVLMGEKLIGRIRAAEERHSNTGCKQMSGGEGITCRY